MSHRRKFLLYALLLLLPLLSAWFFLSYHTSEFSGDGTIAYFGPFRMSYRVDFIPSIPLDEPGEYRYRFRGLPSDDNMGLLLDVVGKTDKNEAELVNLRTILEMSLTDGEGRVICSASGMPHFGEKPNSWVLQEGIGVQWWHPNCVSFATVRGESYTLIVRIKDVDPRSPKTSLKPYLEGGGIETP